MKSTRKQYESRIKEKKLNKNWRNKDKSREKWGDKIKISEQWPNENEDKTIRIMRQT